MLSKLGCEKRKERLWEEILPGIDWLIVGDPRHVNYLSGFCVNPLSASMGQRAFLLLERSGRTTLVCDSATRSAAASPPVADTEVIEGWYGGSKNVENRETALLAALRRACNGLGRQRGLVEREWFLTDTADALGIASPGGAGSELSLSRLLRKLRRQKEDDEVELLRACMRAGKAGQDRAREIIAAGMSELELYTEIQSAAVRTAGQPVVVYGEFRASSPDDIHIAGAPTDYVLKNGDMIILDFSIVLGGYRSDFTNTLAVGTPSQGLKDLMEVCTQAIDEGEKALSAGAGASAVYAAVNRPMTEAGHPLPHHAGHGLGLEHPEAPALIPESEEVLQNGDVIALEPGAYVDGIGGVRVEHNYLVTEKECERLSCHDLGL